MKFSTTVLLRVSFVLLFYIGIGCRQIALETSFGWLTDVFLSAPFFAWGVWVAFLVFPRNGYLKKNDIYIRNEKEEK